MGSVNTLQPARITYEGVILHALPCPRHSSYSTGCGNCLTGAQAADRGHAQQTEDLGVLASHSVFLPLASPLASAATVARRGLHALLDRIGVS